ncbi:putative transcriptional activator [Encephalitozoon romaleae SJ-2008]|uniref:Transcriptional activator n=1 Tax=Encephalitozoon romaleae (strain SJ-2008) TaxID=1178016 RepID=I7AMN8_ENCRO|nr:putative transcriptional activator [Encephalitozoon romaleae SJ-2008]AFN82994.1 putative transcriptional activator [Encephalitozoon romaleae SJ-2008]
MLKNGVEMDRRRLDFSDESSDDGHDNGYLGFHEHNSRRVGTYEREVGKRSENLISSRHHACGGGYTGEVDSVGKKSHNVAQQENRGNSRLDTPVSIEGKDPHYSSEYFEASDSEEFEEKLASLRFLILEAEEELRNIIRGRIEKHLEANKEANERKREMKRRKREVLGEINKEESKEGNSPEISQEDSDSRREKIESFADFETSMFPYKSKNGIKSYICPYEGCTMELPTLSRIKRHYIVHTKLRPFKCLNKDCNKRFSRKDNMLQHYKIHCSYSNYR